MCRKFIKKILLIIVLFLSLPGFAECIPSKCLRPIPEAVMNHKDYFKDPHCHIRYYTDWKGYEVYHVYYYPTDEELAQHPGQIPVVGHGMFFLYDGKTVRVCNKDEFDPLLMELKKVNIVYAQLRECNRD